jgi:hypothetical protein
MSSTVPLSPKSVRRWRDETAKGLKLARFQIAEEARKNWVKESESIEQSVLFINSVIALFEIMPIYLWEKDLYNEIATKAPKEIFAQKPLTRDLLITPNQLWIPSTSVSLLWDKMEDQEIKMPHYYHMDAVLIISRGIAEAINQIVILGLFLVYVETPEFQNAKTIEDVVPRFRGAKLEIGKCHPEIFQTLAGLHFMKQPFCTIERHRPERMVRREAKRKKQPEPQPINTISLRKKVTKYDQLNKDSEIDWQWRWLVSGHWRDQYYPSKHTNEPIFIQPYIKGPEDKPLKPISERMWHVKR